MAKKSINIGQVYIISVKENTKMAKYRWKTLRRHGDSNPGPLGHQAQTPQNGKKIDETHSYKNNDK